MSDMQKDALRAMRHEHGLSQKAFAERVGLSIAMIGAVESGQRNLSRESVEKIVSGLDLNDVDRQRLLRAVISDRDAQATVGETSSLAARLAELEKRVEKLEQAAAGSAPERHLRAAQSDDDTTDPAPRRGKRQARPSPPAGRDEG